MKWKLFILSVLFSVCCLSACRSVRTANEQPVVMEHAARDTLWRMQTVETHDTVMQRDSFFLYEDGTRLVVRDRYRSSANVRRDTLWRIRTDTIDRPVQVTRTERVEVPAAVPWWQRLLMWIGGLCFASAAIWVGLMVRRR